MSAGRPQERGTAQPLPVLCNVYWGSHGCDLVYGHDGPHLCSGPKYECSRFTEYPEATEGHNLYGTVEYAYFDKVNSEWVFVGWGGKVLDYPGVRYET